MIESRVRELARLYRDLDAQGAVLLQILRLEMTGGINLKIADNALGPTSLNAARLTTVPSGYAAVQAGWLSWSKGATPIVVPYWQ